MLHSLGTKPKEERRDLLSRLLDCHGRIREMLELARRLSDEEGATEDEIAEAADRVRRYFKRALPMHMRDEEQSIAPRLASSASSALHLMTSEHREHEPHVDSLIRCCDNLRSDPSQWKDARAELRAIVGALTPLMATHLEEEERDIFPLLESSLDEATREQIVREMEERRAADGGGGGGGGRGRNR